MQTVTFPSSAAPGSELQAVIASIQQSFQLLRNQAEYYQKQAELCLQESQRLETTLSVLVRGFSAPLEMLSAAPTTTHSPDNPLAHPPESVTSISESNGARLTATNGTAEALEPSAPEPLQAVAPSAQPIEAVTAVQPSKRTRTVRAKRTPKGEFDLRANLPVRYGKAVVNAVVAVLSNANGAKLTVEQLVETIYSNYYSSTDYEDAVTALRRYLVKNKSTCPWQSENIEGQYYFSYEAPAEPVKAVEPAEPAEPEPEPIKPEPVETSSKSSSVSKSKGSKSSKTASKKLRPSKTTSKTASKAPTAAANSAQGRG